MTHMSRTFRKIAQRASCALCFVVFGLYMAQSAQAQFLGFTSPQTTSEIAFNNVTPSPGATFVVKNIGQNVHFFSYTVSGNLTFLSTLVLRLEGSIDGSTFFPISTDVLGFDTATGGGYAVGYYPVVRIKILDFQTSGGNTITVQYSGTSSTDGPPLGTYNASQNLVRAVLVEQPANASAVTTLVSPTGSSMGYVVLSHPSGAGSLPAGSSLTVTCITENGGPILATYSGTALGATAVLGVPDFQGCISLLITYATGGPSAAHFNAYYFFAVPGASALSAPLAQPLSITNSANTQLNAEQVSAANTAQTDSIGGNGGTRVHLYQVSARCSAGTAGITVKDGVSGTTIWTTAATEVGATDYKQTWTPGLTSKVGNGMDIVVSPCGTSNTSTLDVQASQF